MLVSMKELLADAERKNYAVGGFNCPGLEYVLAVIHAAEACGKPVILSFPQVHEKTVPLKTIAPILRQAAIDAEVSVCVHLAHGSDITYIHRAWDLGFHSVMYDGSRLRLEENIETTRAGVELAHSYGADVEAELGGIAGDEAGIATGETADTALTDPDEAERFVRQTNVDSLAASIGTAHGFYTAAPKIDFARIETIRQKTAVLLVMHGGSGIRPEDYTLAIRKGIRKINYYSYMAKAGVDGVKGLLESKDVKYFHEITTAALDAMTENVKMAICLFHPGEI